MSGRLMGADDFLRFHSETRILTTIFALIFWDIIFSRVPGAFETQFQAGPLDMFEDSFYLARRDLFEARLQEIREGKGRDYLKRHDDRYRSKQTWCIGLRWDVCEQGQLLEIVEVGLSSLENDQVQMCPIDPVLVSRFRDPGYAMPIVL